MKKFFLILGLSVLIVFLWFCFQKIYFRTAVTKRQKIPLTLGWHDSKYQLQGYSKSYSDEDVLSPKKADLDNDGNLEKVLIDNHQLFIYKAGRQVWKSNFNWSVENFLVADLNQDGDLEVSFSLWKKDGDTLGNHLFLYDFRKQKFAQIWCSSVLDAPIKEMLAFDINLDQKIDLIVLEGNYQNPGLDFSDYLTVWSWNGWGFTNKFRSPQSQFENLTLKNQEILFNELIIEN